MQDFRPLEPAWLRTLVLVGGHLALVCGLVGVLLPIVPTLPFLVVAAACYARASARFYTWLIDHKWLGPPVREWRRHHSLTGRQKLGGIFAVSVGFASSLALFVPPGWTRITGFALWAVFVLVLLLIPLRPSPEKPAAS